MTDKIQTTWIWYDEVSTGTMGAMLDTSDHEIQWIDQPGCACGDNMQIQSMEDFLNSGAAVAVPQDVLDEMHTAVGQIMGQIDES